MEPPEDMEGRSFVEVMSEKYSPENFPYRRGPRMGVVVVPTAGPQGSPMKGELEVNNDALIINEQISPFLLLVSLYVSVVRGLSQFHPLLGIQNG